MVVGGRPVLGNLDFWFSNVVVADDRGQMEAVSLNGWKDLPMELLLRIVLGDDRTVIVASGVCTGWRDAICTGLARLCLSWYSFIFHNNYTVSANGRLLKYVMQIYNVVLRIFFSRIMYEQWRRICS